MAELIRSVYAGQVFKIEAYVTEGGECLAEAWLDRQSEAMQKRFVALFMTLGDQGKIWNETKFKHLEGSDGIFEFKADGGRVLCFFFVGHRVVLTHGFKKQGPKTPRGEIVRAEDLKKIFLQRSGK